MKKFAVIDIGSNSVRLMFVADGNVLYKRLNTTRLGEGIATSNTLKNEAIERSAIAVADFFNQAKSEGAESVYAFATAAVRTAKNGSAFVERVKELCGLDVDVVAGEKEAELGIVGALGARDGAVIDVGGASTEIVVKENGRSVYKKSVDIGVVRLKDTCGKDRSLLEKAAKGAVEKFGQVPLQGEIWAIGGTATTLASIFLGLTEYDSKKITGTVITVEEMRAISEKLLAMQIEEIAELPCMPKGRADVLTGGAVLLATLMERLAVKKMIVSDRDNLEGYAIEKGLMK